MNRIRLLPEQVANQIAAGEVIERPASVVKELVENALDAGAERLTVEIGAGGRSLIRVTDDGIGMSRDDALLSLERHATSKIKRAEDLASITTMGFRGEALPSIASVSRMSLVTRERDTTTPAATQIVIHGGRIQAVQEAGAPPGTSIEVRNLFYNLPARRKFLRTEATETAHVEHYLTLAALAHPHVGFTFMRDGRVVWQLHPQPEGDTPNLRFKALQERMRALLGGNDLFLPVNFEGLLPSRPGAGLEDDVHEADSPAYLRVWGYTGAPGVSRATREAQYLFVNRRPIENRGLNFALIEGYHTALMKGRYPVCCLFLETDPARVDVNIHPAKREVKFHDEREVRRLVAQAIRETLLRHHLGGTAQSTMATDAAPKPSPPPPPPPAGGPEPATAPLPLTTPATTNRVPLYTPPPHRPPPQPAPLINAPEARTKYTAHPRPGPPASPPEGPLEPVPLLRVPLRLVGVVGQLYVVLESDRGLVLLDQHAAHERVLFEQMMRRLESGAAPSQRLLLAETIELAPRDAQFARELLPTLARLGIGLSEFGERTFLLDSLPPSIQTREPRRFLLDVLDELRNSGESVNTLRLSEDVVARTVCRHAVKAHDPLAGPELENLLAELRQCAMPYTCPHGRPTLIEMSYRDLEKKFGRLV